MGTQNYRDLTISNSVIGDGGKLINNNFINLANRIGKCNYSSVVDPTSANNDTNGGYTTGSRWFNLSTNAEFVCVYIDPNTHDATWSKTVEAASSQIKTVKTDPSGPEYSSIAAALNSIGDNGPNKRYVVRVYPGTYTEPVCTIPDYVYVVGENIDTVVVQPNNATHDVFVLSNRSGIVNLTVTGAGGGFAAVRANNIGAWGLLHKVTITDSDIGIHFTTSTTASALYLEYVDFTDCTISIHNKSAGGFESLLNCENLYLEYSAANPVSAIIIEGPDAIANIQGFSGVGVNDTGNCIRVTDSGYLNMTSARIVHWARGIYADDTGSAEIEMNAVDFDDNVYNFYIDSNTCSGYFIGYTAYAKQYIKTGAPFFIANEDKNVKQVAMVGGEFSSIGAALASITDNDHNNRYVVSIGPGVYIEDTLEMKDYVSVVGLEAKTTVVELKALPTHPYLIYANNVNSTVKQLFFRTVAGSAIHYQGGTFKINNCRFGNCTLGIDASGVNGPDHNHLNVVESETATDCNSTLLMKFSDDGTHYLNVTINGFTTANTPGGILHDFAEIGLTAGGFFGGKTEVSFENCTIVGDGTGCAIKVADGADCHVIGSTVKDFDKGLHVLNEGVVGPEVEIVGSLIYDNITYDIQVEHLSTAGSINAVADREKVSIVAGCTVGLSINDSDDGSLTVTGKYFQGETFDVTTDVTETITKEPTLGVTQGGAIIDLGGQNVKVEAGKGYLQIGVAPNETIKYVEWDEVASLPIADNKNLNIYVDSNAVVQTSASVVPALTTIFLGRVVTNDTDIIMLVDTKRDAVAAGTKYDTLFRLYLGAIYRTGSLVEAIPASRTLKVGSGDYVFSTRIFTPSGSAGAAVTFSIWYPDTASSWYIISTGQTVVPNTQYYDAGTNALKNMTDDTHYVKHAFYTYGDGTTERYFLVYGQEEFGSLNDARTGAMPTTPSPLSISAVLIAGIIMQKNTATITEVLQLQPTLVSRAGTAVTAPTVHGALDGLNVVGDHPGYLTLDGLRQMSGDLDMNGNDIVTGVGLVDGVDVSAHKDRHLPGGADALTVAAPNWNISPAITNSAGSQASFSRSDHKHTIGRSPISTGATQAEPTFTDLTNGTATISACDYMLYSTSDFTGDLLLYNVPAKTVPFAADINSYVVVNYNLGTPEYRVITDVELITESDVIPVFTVYRHDNGGKILHAIAWDRVADGITNKLHQRLVKTERIVRETGLGLGENAGTRQITIESGKFWYGGIRKTADAYDSGTLVPGAMTHFWYHDGAGNWLLDTTPTQYNNTQYDNGTGLVGLTDGYYTINWVYRGLESVAHGHFFLGAAQYSTIAAAIEAQIPADIPPMVLSSAQIIGRIIIKKGVNTGATGTNGLIESAFSVTFKTVPVNDHNLLYNIQGGSAGEFYHFTSAQHTDLTDGGGTTLHSHASITGTLPIANGGTNSATALAGTGRAIVSSASAIVEHASTTATQIGYLSSLTATANRIITTNAGGTGIEAASAITASRALVSNASGIPIAATNTTAAEIEFVNGVTSGIQGQLNGKQATGNYITALTSEVTASGPGSAAATLSNAAVIGKVLTGYASTTGAITAGDSILVGIEKLDGNKQATGNYITALTSDVTASGPGSAAATIANNAVTNAKAAQMGANTIKGNNTAGTANAADLTLAQATAMLNVMTGGASTGLKGLVPAQVAGDITLFLRGDATWASPTAVTSAYGVIYLNAATATTTSGNNAWSKITAYDTDGLSSNTTVDGVTNKQITVTNTGIYEVLVNGSASWPGNSVIMIFGVSVGGVSPVTNAQTRLGNPSNSNGFPINIKMSAIMSLSAGNVLTLAANGPAGAIIVTYYTGFSLSVKRIS